MDSIMEFSYPCALVQFALYNFHKQHNENISLAYYRDKIKCVKACMALLISL